MAGMKGKEIKEDELEKDSWVYTLTFGFHLKLFKKEKEYILWNSRTQKVYLEWSED